MRRPLPDVPGVSAFPELNVRLYVEAQGKPGVWFLSLDATNPLAVWAARRFFHLPYHRADITLSQDQDTIAYRAQRSDKTVEFAADYGPIGSMYESRPGTLENWLTERYCLYARSPDGRLFRNDVHHVPWPLFDAEADIRANTMVLPYGISLPDEPPLLHFSPRLDVVVWNAEQVC